MLAGRLLIAAGLLAAMVVFPWPADAIANSFVPDEPPKIEMADWSAGKSVKVKITLITADFDRLGCVLDREIGGAHCEYRAETELWDKDPNVQIDDNKKTVIQPYSMAPTNQLIMVAGLWAQSELAMRLHEEPPAAIPEKKLARFIAECDVRLIEQVQQIAIRWSKDAAWGKQGPAWVAIAESCKLIEA